MRRHWRSALTVIVAAGTLVVLPGASLDNCGSPTAPSVDFCRAAQKDAGVVYDRKPPSSNLSSEYTLRVRKPNSTNVDIPTGEQIYNACDVGEHYPECFCGQKGK